MPVNILTAQAGLRVGPLLLETLVKHYFDRITKDALKKTEVQLRRDELLYDQAFSIIKMFLEVATYHTVEEVQGFGNTRTPSPPWVRVVRVLVSTTCCDDAATYLVQALGGEELARRVVGGVKWWQVRGISGVDCQWITAKKDWREAKRRYKMQQKTKSDVDPVQETGEATTYDKDMDEMRCILYLHGGGYYFGSVDQERYSIQRHARKINGRVFAVNYRLAPQYPFPCALQDVLAAYLYLINPPPDAHHRPVKPSHIVVAGDSAGGGISLALLQVIRDSGLPMPAGGVLISPWCDLTHSFPSIHLNTDTDIIPKYGLSLQKPSVLWPPPSQEMTRLVHASLRSRIRQAFKMDPPEPNTTVTTLGGLRCTSASGMPVDVGATAALPSLSSGSQTINMTTASGDVLKIDHQVHMYAQNSLLGHPLVSPAMSYLGGLPPLFFIDSDKEVLRDEIIYAAHKAAYPERFPIREELRNLYPPLKGIESRRKATRVHLQVYDDAAHTLPVLFSFTTPGKFCYRAIASFCKSVTGMTQTPETPVDESFSVPSPPHTPTRKMSFSANILSSPKREPVSRMSSMTLSSTPSEMSEDERAFSPVQVEKKTLRRAFSESVRKRSIPHAWHKHHELHPLPSAEHANGATVNGNGDCLRQDNSSSGVAGPHFHNHHSHHHHHGSSPSRPGEGPRMAGDPVIYAETFDDPEWKGIMIRERVSTQGVIRPLEPESELDALKVPVEFMGAISELAARRFIEGQAKFDKKFSNAVKAIEKHRIDNLKRAKKDTMRNIAVLQHSLEKEGKTEGDKRIKDGLLEASGSWSWAWALDAGETPPPSSIVSRRDTDEARRLAKIADQAVFPGEHSVTGNNLWQVLVNFLTVTPDKEKGHEHDKDATVRRRTSLFAKFGPSLSQEKMPEAASRSSA
ncbi:alpha/beta-hydrolase [Guyanagaster necrorhizus]|uniref:Alpha/beta-hydrolase n=1 Tax=Guyanagaster necrorhizus TaxID=856835 RepID=A0A9P8AW26_9AGAR|nr:alpha/beta-hydrolase [Guyanagaster necrorhizus MCA 3950]KAG7449721.1 alpha/beta-hydrolase [Guyanagaster necrorhizus MCA 3950]